MTDIHTTEREFRENLIPKVQVINNDMTLDEKLAAIDKAMAEAQEQAVQESKRTGQPIVPVDPSLLTICDGCE